METWAWLSISIEDEDDDWKPSTENGLSTIRVWIPSSLTRCWGMMLTSAAESRMNVSAELLTSPLMKYFLPLFPSPPKNVLKIVGVGHGGDGRGGIDDGDGEEDAVSIGAVLRDGGDC